MARQSPNLDRNFSAGYEKSRNPEIDRLLAAPPLPWADVLNDQIIRERFGKLIAEAVRRASKPDSH